MIPIKHLMHINSSVEDVFSALSNVEKMKKWYTTNIEGIFAKNEVVTFEFVNLATFKFKVIHFESNKSIHIECVDSEWDNIGHKIKYDLDENNGKTRVRYSYEGFEEMDDANMNYSSGKYLESLRQFCQTGTGEAFGSGTYRA